MFYIELFMLEDRQAFKQHVGAPPPSRVQKVTLGDNLKGASILRECGLASSSSSSSSQKDIQRQTLQLIDSIPKRAKGVRVRPCAIALEPLNNFKCHQPPERRCLKHATNRATIERGLRLLIRFFPCEIFSFLSLAQSPHAPRQSYPHQ